MKKIVYDIGGIRVLWPDTSGKHQQIIRCPRCLTDFGPPIDDPSLAYIRAECNTSSMARYRRARLGHIAYARHLAAGCIVIPGGIDIATTILAGGINQNEDFTSRDAKHKDPGSSSSSPSSFIPFSLPSPEQNEEDGHKVNDILALLIQ